MLLHMLKVLAMKAFWIGLFCSLKHSYNPGTAIGFINLTSLLVLVLGYHSGGWLGVLCSWVTMFIVGMLPPVTKFYTKQQAKAVEATMAELARKGFA